MLLKLRCGKSLSNVAFNFNLRRYIQVDRLRRASPQSRVLMGAVLQRLVFESYNTRAAVDADAAAAAAADAAPDAAPQSAPTLWQQLPPLPLSAMPPVEPHIVTMLTRTADSATVGRCRLTKSNPCLKRLGPCSRN
jgi:hypothetical protein